MAGYILKYSAGTYQRKISALEGYYSQLVTHLEQLNTLQGQMKDFLGWFCFFRRIHEPDQ